VIYLDVDGVIADFYVGCVALGWEGDLFGGHGKLEKFMADNYTQIFRTSPPTKNMEFFREMYAREKDMKILTARGSHYKKEHISTVIENKHFWLNQFGFKSEDIIVVEQSKDKLPYCQPGDVLYDDKRWTIQKWNELGGMGFLVYYEHSWDKD
jgi:hypothetical protein